MAVCELCEAADALILPVRMNYVKPTAPFPLSNVQMEGSFGCQEMFEVEPLQRHTPRPAPGAQPPADNPPPDQDESDEAAGASMSRSGLALSSQRASRRSREPVAPASVVAPSDGHDNEGGSSGAVLAAVRSRRGSGLTRHSFAGVDGGGGGGGDRAEAAEREDAAEGEAGESDMELDLLAESDSDSEDNQSGVDNASAQRSVQTGATAGSEADDDSGDTSGGEDDDDQSEAAETDEFDSGDLFSDEQLERRMNAAASSRSNVAPHHLQWAIRNTLEGSGGAGTRSGAGGGAGGGPNPSASNITTSGIYIDPTSLRRGPSCGSAVTPAAHEPVSLATTNSTLARAFTVVIRHMSSLVSLAAEAARDGPAARSGALSSQNITQALVVALLHHLDSRLQPTWDWLLSLMDSTEAQLR